MYSQYSKGSNFQSTVMTLFLPFHSFQSVFLFLFYLNSKGEREILTLTVIFGSARMTAECEVQICWYYSERVGVHGSAWPA